MKSLKMPFRGKKTVRFEECDLEPTDTEFYQEFNRFNQSSLWICLVFLMTVFVQFSLEIDNIIFDIASRKEESCVYTKLHVLQWKYNETASIFYPEFRLPCMMYDYNVSEFIHMKFIDAKKLLEGRSKPDIIFCSEPLWDNFSWSTEFIGTCSGALYRRGLRATKLLGIAAGSFALGIVADLYGRKMSIYISVAMYYFGTAGQQLMANFFMVLLLTFIKGAAHGALKLVVPILFLEYCSKNNRALLCIYIKILCPIGMILGIYMKNHLNGFRPELRFIVGLPSLVFIFYAWYVPESPRWCLSYCHKETAWKFLNSMGVRTSHLQFLPKLSLNKRQILRENLKYIFTVRKLLTTVILGTYLLFFLLTVEYSKNQYIGLRGHLKPYAHHALLTMTKWFSFMYVLPPIIILRRRLALLWLLLLITIQLFANLIYLDFGYIYVSNVLMMLLSYGSRCLFSLYMCEIFPTCLRATAYGLIRLIGYCLCFAYYMNDLRFKFTLYVDTVVLCVLTSIGLVAVPFFPEVRHYELPDYKRYRRDYEQVSDSK